LEAEVKGRQMIANTEKNKNINFLKKAYHEKKTRKNFFEETLSLCLAY